MDPLCEFVSFLNMFGCPNRLQNLTGGVQGGIHVSDPTNASRTLLMDLRKLEWSQPLLKFFGFRPSILPKLVSSSQVYGSIASGSLKGIRIAGIVGDQQGALVGNKCFKEGEAKCTYGTGMSCLLTTRMAGRLILRTQAHFYCLPLGSSPSGAPMA